MVGGAIAQVTPMIRPQAGPPGQAEAKGPTGEAKLRWVCNRLRLDEKQKLQVDALIAIYHAQIEELKADPDELGRRMKEKFGEIQAARAEGNNDLVSQLQNEMRDLMPEAAAEKNFYDTLGQSLSEEQREKLVRLREQVKDAPAISLRPAHVLKTIRGLNLTSEQNRQIEKLLDEYRESLRTANPKEPSQSEQMVEQLIDKLRTVLTEEQAKKYDDRIEELRIGAPNPVPVTLSTGDAASTRGAVAPVMPRKHDAQPIKKPAEPQGEPTSEDDKE